MTEVVVDNGKAFVSEESATISTEAAAQAKQWAQESERQANIATSNADIAVQAKDDAVAAKNYAEAAITDTNLVTVATDLQDENSNIKTVSTNISNVNSVGGNIANVNAVAGNATNINAVNANKTNINAVNANKANINIVAGINSDVSAVAGIAASVPTVANDLTNVDKVANKISKVNTVAGSITNVNAVADSIANVNTAATNISDINTVADSVTDVNTVAAISNNVTAVAGNATNINAVNANKTNIDTVAADITNVNAVAGDLTNIDAVNANKTNINAVAGNATNINTAVANINAIIDAPNQAAAAKQWAIGEPSEPAGYSAKHWAEVAEDAASGVQNPANRDLSNLSSDGQMIVDSVNGTISNCVLEIPQNIKLEFSNGTVTLKAGSIITRTGSTYSTITTTQDTSWATTTISNTKAMLFVSNSGYAQDLYGRNALENIGSGSSLPANGNTYKLFFNTTDKIIYRWIPDNGSWEATTNAYPLAVVEIDSQGAITGFAKDSNGNDMIFNGAGFIGHHAFVYPNVTVFYPNGYSDVKHLNSVKITTNQLYITELATNRNCLFVASYSSQVASIYRGADLNDKNLITINNEYHYITTENYIYSKISSGYVQRPLTFFVDYTYNGTTVTDFTIRQPIRLATTEMLNNGLAQKQDTLVSGTNIKTINSTSVLGNGNFALADQSLSNLNSNGQMVVDSQNGTISNCILEIPQNIKISISNNVITLASGSVVALTGYNTYTTRTTTADITKDSWVSSWYNKTVLLYIGSTGTWFGFKEVSKVGSGSSLPADNTNFDDFYLTTDYSWYEWENSTWSKKNFSYPLAIVNVDSSGVPSFAKDSNSNDMIFNGAGFIGHHAVVYPNVKGLIPDGFNADGSLKSSSRTQNALIIKEITSGSHTWMLVGANNYNLYSAMNYYEVSTYKDITPSAWAYYYVKDENRLYSANGSSVIDENSTVAFFKVTYDGTTVTDFTIRQPVRMATVEMLKDKQNKLTFDTAPTSNSTNPVTSGGVYTALAAKADDNAVVHLAEDETITGNKTFSGTNTFVTPAVSDNSQKPATTAYVNNKFQVVSALPASPDADTFYFIEES